MASYVRLTQAGTGRAVYVPPPFAVEDLGGWKSSTAQAQKEPRAAVLWSGTWFRVTETAEQIIELVAKAEAEAAG